MKEGKAWNPYLGGALTGMLGVLSVLITGKFLGASTTFARSAAMVEQIFAPEHVAALDYFQKVSPKIDWQWMFVAGIMIGAFFSAITSNSFRIQNPPDMWVSRFGNSQGKRALFAFVGGAIAIFGARLADGCPSGHGLSGVMQLSISGFIALACFFIGGVPIAYLLYRGGDR
ncbi:MAG: YeeE/YedE family protein [Desulfobulbaceae bacterium DB1]|nr:MAG: YeeE/YedE family protein [Desulfobulbaceae bacterium DB1]